MPKTHIELIVAGLIIFTAGIISGFSLMSPTVPEANVSAAAMPHFQPAPPVEKGLLDALQSVDPERHLRATDDIIAAPQSE